ncbi:MAG: hypothetical protein R2822_28460 [Spirosomataceae bacterium]
MGFQSALISEAFIYHVVLILAHLLYNYFFGRARINIARFYPNELKWVHTFPFVFSIG